VVESIVENVVCGAVAVSASAAAIRRVVRETTADASDERMEGSDTVAVVIAVDTAAA